MSFFRDSLFQHYAGNVAAHVSAQVQADANTANLVTNAASMHTTMLSNHAKAPYAGDKVPRRDNQSIYGKGYLLCYTADSTLVLRLDVDILVSTGGIDVSDAPEQTPMSIQKMGRFYNTNHGFYDAPAGGFHVAAPRMNFELIPIAGASGVLTSGSILYHSTILGAGAIASSFLMVTEDSNAVALTDLPDEPTIKGTTPEGLTLANPEFKVRWVKLPVGSVGSDVVRLSSTTAVKNARLIAHDSVRFSINTLTVAQETAVMSNVREKLDSLGYEVTDNVTT
jgi:hypothetical protein